MLSVNIVLPAYNEEKILDENVEKTLKFLEGIRGIAFRVTIVDNGSIDRTLEKAQTLKREHRQVDVIHIDERGRGRALKKAWSSSHEDIVGYMDADLSTQLENLKSMLDSFNDGFDMIVGSRLMKDSRVKRSLKRELFSRGYNILLKIVLGVGFTDAQCGFKFLRRVVAQELLPLISDNEWFFDTELLTKAAWIGHSIKEIPVTWVERRETKVEVIGTTLKYLKSILRLMGERPRLRHSTPKT